MKQLHGRIADVREWPDWVETAPLIEDREIRSALGTSRLGFRRWGEKVLRTVGRPRLL
jgi:hypothetical protein